MRFLDWLLRSSADPRKTSLTVKAAMLGVLPAVLHFIGAACSYGLVCLGVDETTLNVIIETIGELTFWFLTAVSAVGFIYGLVRKLINTFQS